MKIKSVEDLICYHCIDHNCSEEKRAGDCVGIKIYKITLREALTAAKGDLEFYGEAGNWIYGNEFAMKDDAEDLFNNFPESAKVCGKRAREALKQIDKLLEE